MKLVSKHRLLGLLILLVLIGCTNKKVVTRIEGQYLFVKLGDVQVQFVNDAKFSMGELVKWDSGLKEVIYTEHGRLVKTENFTKGDLVFSYANTKDPLALGLLKKSTPKQWSRLVDWSDKEMGVALESQFSYVGAETIRLPKRPESVETRIFIEKVNVPSLSISYVNKFWIDEETGFAVKSEQYFNPRQPPIVLMSD